MIRKIGGGGQLCELWNVRSPESVSACLHPPKGFIVFLFERKADRFSVPHCTHFCSFSQKLKGNKCNRLPFGGNSPFYHSVILLLEVFVCVTPLPRPHRYIPSYFRWSTHPLCSAARSHGSPCRLSSPREYALSNLLFPSFLPRPYL